MKHILEFNEFINEAKETVTYKGDTYTADFIKQKDYDSLTWHLLLKDKAGKIYAWPSVFSYHEGWTQGIGRSQKQYFLDTIGYGGVRQGSGQTSQTTPRYIEDQLEYIVKHWKGDGYSKDNQKWYQENVYEFPKGTKKSDIKNALG